MYEESIGFQPKNCMSGHDFELWTQGILTALGFNAKLTGGNDNGVDIIATITVDNRDYKFYIQCKFYNKTVGKTPVQEVYTGCKYFGGDGYPVVITTNRMTAEARAYAKKLGVEVITEYQLNELQIAVKQKKKINTNLTGLFGLILALTFRDTDSMVHAISVYEKTPIADIEKPTDKEQLKSELLSAFDQADLLLQEATEKQAEVFRVQQQALSLQKSALLKNLEYG